MWLLGGSGVLLWAALSMLLGGSAASAADAPAAHVSASAHVPTHPAPPGHGNAHQEDRGAAHKARGSTTGAQKTATQHVRKAVQLVAHTAQQQVAPHVRKTVQHVAQRAQHATQKAQKAQKRSLVIAAHRAQGHRADVRRMHHDVSADHAAPHSRHSDSTHRWQERHPSARTHAASTHRHRPTASAPTPVHTAAPATVTTTSQTEQRAQEPEDSDADVTPVTPFPESAVGGEAWSMTSSQASGGSAPSVATYVTSAAGPADPDAGSLGSRAASDDELPPGPADSAESFPD